MEAASKAAASFSKGLAATSTGEPGGDAQGVLQLHMTAFICLALAVQL